MTVLFFEALAAIAVSLSILMAFAWVVQQRSGNSGWVDTIWTFAVGLVGAGSALWPAGGAAPNARQWLVAALVAVWSLRLGSHIAIRTADITDDPRYAAFAKEWGVNSARRMFVFLQNQALRIDSAGVCDLCCRAVPRRCAAVAGRAGRADPVHRHRRRGACRCAAQTVPRRPRQQGPRLRYRAVALVAPSELFLRMVLLAGLSRDRPVGRLSVCLSSAYPWGLATLLAPVFMYWILVYVTGIPPLEEQMLRSRGERYRAYQLRTSKFFPLPPARA